MELTRYGASCVVLPGTRPLPGYGSAPWVWVRFLGMGCLHAMRWSSVTVSAILSDVESRGLPNRRVACTMPKITGKASRSREVGGWAGSREPQSRVLRGPRSRA